MPKIKNIGRKTNNVVTVQVPAKVAYDLPKISRIQKDILGRLGCLACCSGWDIRWEIENQFRVDDKLKISTGF